MPQIESLPPLVFGLDTTAFEAGLKRAADAVRRFGEVIGPLTDDPLDDDDPDDDGDD